MKAATDEFNLSHLDARAREVFKDIVDSYLETGQPIGSRTLSRMKHPNLSPATLRNTMADLAHLGLLSASHTSAGRIPTHQGLRLFVDGLLETGDMGQADKTRLESALSAQGQDPQFLFEQASSQLSGLAGGAGLVLTPNETQPVSDPVKHVEFVSLDHHQVLVVLVYTNGRVENRLMHAPQGVLPASLSLAGQFLSNRLQGRRLEDARSDILAEISQGQAEINRSAAQLIEDGLAEWSTPDTGQERRTLIVRGRSKLLKNLQAQSSLERIEKLFDDLERKEDLIALLDQAEAADGVKIFIGAENPIFSLSDSSVVIAPYRDQNKKIIGAIGVIGPTRINYARIIPMVDYTAHLVGRMLNAKKG